jgi:hypothetical protein
MGSKAMTGPAEDDTVLTHNAGQEASLRVKRLRHPRPQVRPQGNRGNLLDCGDNFLNFGVDVGVEIGFICFCRPKAGLTDRQGCTCCG